MPLRPRPGLAAAAFLACVLIWGSTWLAIKVGYGGVGPITGAALRFALATLLLAGLARAWGLPLRLRGAHLRLALFVGCTQFVLDYGLIYWAEQDLSSGLTAVLFATMPLFTAGAARLALPGAALGARQLGGAVLGLAGLGLIFREALAAGAGAPAAVPMLAILASAACAAAATVATKRDGKDLHPVSLFVTAMGVGAAGLAAWALLAGERLALPATALAWASVLHLAVFGSVAGFLLYYWLLRTHDPVKLSFVTVLTPLVALALGAALLGERVGGEELAGAALVLLGVGLSLAPPRRVGAPRPGPAGDAAAPKGAEPEG